MELHRGLLEQSAASGLGDDGRHAGGRRGIRGRARRSGLADGADRTTYGKPKAIARRARLLLDRRSVVERERLERLDHVAAVQVEENVARRDQLVEHRARETSVKVPSYEPGKQRLRFLPSSGTTNGVRARNDGMLTIGTAVIRPAELAACRARS